MGKDDEAPTCQRSSAQSAQSQRTHPGTDSSPTDSANTDRESDKPLMLVALSTAEAVQAADQCVPQPLYCTAITVTAVIILHTPYLRCQCRLRERIIATTVTTALAICDECTESLPFSIETMLSKSGNGDSSATLRQRRHTQRPWEGNVVRHGIVLC